MKYAYYDLGEQQEGSTVVIRLRGSAANVLLLDSANFASYRAGEPFLYTGGHYVGSPVHLDVPKDGHWYVVLDTGGYRGKVRGDVEVVSGDGVAHEPVREAASSV